MSGEAWPCQEAFEIQWEACNAGDPDNNKIGLRRIQQREEWGGMGRRGEVQRVEWDAEVRGEVRWGGVG